MKTITTFPLLTLLLLALSGCSGQPKEDPKAQDKGAKTDRAMGTSDSAAEARDNVQKLPAEDRKLAEEQGYCAVEFKNPLGSMGVPVKVMVKGQPVFLCCDACETKAKAHADRTLTRVQQLKEKRAETPPK